MAGNGSLMTYTEYEKVLDPKAKQGQKNTNQGKLKASKRELCASLTNFNFRGKSGATSKFGPEQ